MADSKWKWSGFPDKDGICLEEYNGEDVAVEIESHFEGEKVIKVGEYLLSARDNLLEVEIGDGILELGNHCFYDSRSLNRVELTDSVRSMGDGAFKNCESLRTIILHSSRGRDACIREILSECWQEILVEIRYPDRKAVLIFPEYDLEYFENFSTVPNLFYTEVYGSGQAYRQCLQGTAIDYRAYDRLLEKSARDDRGPVSAGIALNRLRYPVGLTEERREAYRRHLKEKAPDAVRWCLEQDEDGIPYLCDLGIFGEENLEECLQVAEEAQDPAVIAALLAESMKLTTKKRPAAKRYDW